MDIGIDLGTANIVMTMGKRGVVLNEPSVIAFHKRTEQVVAIGRKAYAMIGRAPDYLAVVRPLKDGVISILTEGGETLAFAKKDVAIVRPVIEFNEEDLQDDVPVDP